MESFVGFRIFYFLNMFLKKIYILLRMFSQCDLSNEGSNMSHNDDFQMVEYLFYL